MLLPVVVGLQAPHEGLVRGALGGVVAEVHDLEVLEAGAGEEAAGAGAGVHRGGAGAGHQYVSSIKNRIFSNAGSWDTV